MTLRKALLMLVVLVFSVIVLFLIFFFSEASKGNITIIVDGSIKYQEIAGFGGSGAYYESLVKNMREPKRTEVLNLLFSDLGISIYRLRVWTKIEPVNDDNDPNHFNWEAFRFSTGDSQIWNAQRAKERGITKFIASVWSPPAWMKNTGKESGGGYLLPEMYQEFAEFLAAYIIGYKNNYGIDIGWISIQNEPDFVTDQWETCAYTPAQMKEVIKVVGAKFRAEGLSTKILIPETAGCSRASDYISVIMSDPEAAQYVDVFAHHLYGGDYYKPDDKIPAMQALAEARGQFNRPIWQTEYSDGPYIGTFEEALATAHHIHNVLTVEDASAYLYWALFWYRGGLISIDRIQNSYKVNPVYYAFKQYSGFVKPGFRRIYATSSDSKLLVSAYLNETSNRITIVVINEKNNSVKAKINLKGVSPPNNFFQQYCTSRSENCAFIGDVIISDNFLEVVVAPQSITTFVG